MASSDEEGEIIPDCIINYHLVDYKGEPISFSALPLQWSEDEIPDDLSTLIYLHGSADNGLQQIYKKVIAWKFELSYVLPEIYVLSKDKTWIMLQKPRKSFENTIKTLLVAVHCLHFLKKNPEASKDALWNHLQKAFSSYEFEPSEKDLLDHKLLINKAAIRDKDIAKSECLAALLLDIPCKRKVLHEENQSMKKSKFIVDAVDYDIDEDDDDDDNDDDGSILFDSVCALCDNGGELLCCEGRCIRSFHATADAGADSLCESLGYTDAQIEAIQSFLCKNCQSQQHQCFVCGILGSSNKSSGAEVFSCVSATCGHFYHPKCVAELLHPCDKIQAEEVQKEIAAGESFICPAHKCFACKQGEDKKVYDLQFAMCRRCPKAYHRKCLPRTIAFEVDGDKNIHQRAWDGLLPNRILIYCMDHKIIPQLGTPERNHILFSGVFGRKKQYSLELSGKNGTKVVAEKRNTKVMAEKSTVSASLTQQTALRMPKRVEKDHFTFTGGNSTKKFDKGFSSSELKVTDVAVKSLRENNVPVQANMCKPPRPDKMKSLLRNGNSTPSMRTQEIFKQQDFASGKAKNTTVATPVMKKVCNTQPLVDPEMEKRMLALMQRSTSSFNMEEFIKKQKMLSNKACSSRFVVERTITRGRVEGSVKAIRAALKKLEEEGCTTDDAKDICQPAIIKQIVKWKDKLKLYLAPFLHGMRYTSFGRHFTKVDKLKEIVDRLHWYVQGGDMIVDFCCGSNDFSCLLKEKLDQMGKSCSFRNYDLIQSKNDFNFEKRDWMSVRLEELPAGSQLIMGLNPPFGAHASRANQFIDEALKFKPKLLILIVPRETKRLDGKDPPYDLIWEDDKLLSGKSFYLPGSVDVHDQQMEQWNLEAPPLYLWSRPDWTAKHKAVAQKHGHLYKEQEERHAKGKNVETVVSNYLMEENHDCYGDFSNIMNGCGDISRILDDVPEDSGDVEHEGARDEQQESLYHSIDGIGRLHYDAHRNNLPSYDLNKMQCEGKWEMDRNETSQIQTLRSRPALQINEMYVDMEMSTPPNSPCPITRLPEHAEASYTARQGGHQVEFGTEHAMFHTTVPNATGTGYMQMNEGAFLNGAYNRSGSTNYGYNGSGSTNCGYNGAPE